MREKEKIQNLLDGFRSNQESYEASSRNSTSTVGRGVEACTEQANFRSLGREAPSELLKLKDREAESFLAKKV